MKITELKTYIVGNPWKNWVFVKVFTDEGLTGIGEATGGLSAKPGEAQVHELERFVIGEDPLQPERLWQRMYKGMFLGSNVGMNAIEIACWDILGKSLNAPLWKLLGGKQRPRLRVYANGWYQGPRDPVFFAEAAAKLKSMGYTAMKFDPFGSAYRFLDASEEKLSLSIVRAARKAVGDDFDLCIEGHDRFSVSTAIRIGQQLEEFRPMWFETPVMSTDIPATIEVARAIKVPVATGERFGSLKEVMELVSYRAVDIVQCETLHIGGVSGARQSRGDRRIGGGVYRPAPGAKPAEHGHQRAHPRQPPQLSDPGMLRRFPGALGARYYARCAKGYGWLPGTLGRPGDRGRAGRSRNGQTPLRARLFLKVI